MSADPRLAPAARVALAAPAPARRKRFRFARAVTSTTSGRIAVGFLVFIVLVAILAPVLSRYDPTSTDFTATNQPPLGFGGSTAHPLGTDTFGRDLLSRLMFGARISLFVGVFAASVSAIAGTLLGLLAGYYERFLGPFLLRLAEIQFSLPFTVLALAVIAVYGPGLRNLLILLSVVGWAGYARTIAVSVSQANRMDFVTAARLQGAGARRILLRHILPNVWGPVVVLWSTSAGVLMLAESGLSFIGLGVQSPQFSWGSMLAEAQSTLQTEWWEALFPGLALTLTVVAFNLLGDAIRDALNVRLGNDS
jgi:peptide/nickel transport system permease protein